MALQELELQVILVELEVVELVLELLQVAVEGLGLVAEVEVLEEVRAVELVVVAV